MLPSLGRLSIAHGGRRVQAKLALPAAETRDASGLAEVGCCEMYIRLTTLLCIQKLCMTVCARRSSFHDEL